MSPFLFKLGIRYQKLALYHRDRIDLTAFTDVHLKDIAVEKNPYPHVVVDNFFKPEVYEALCRQFNDVRRRGFLNEKWGSDRFHLFDMDYDGYVYSPPAVLDSENPLSLFFSLEWNWFFSKLFRQFTTFETMFAFHHHPPGDRTGFVHHDNVDKRFSTEAQLPNGVIWTETKPPISVRRRKIAVLFFLENENWQEGDGGELGLYKGDAKTLVKKVAPLNNRLCAFLISPESMHAFQENKEERNSFVQWFHIPSELV